MSYLFKQDSRAAAYGGHLLGRIKVISAQTRAEIDIWPELRGWGERRRRELESFLDAYLVEYPTRSTCLEYGRLVAAARKHGFQVPYSDAWHAATALTLGVPLVTHNARNFEGIPDLRVITEARP